MLQGEYRLIQRRNDERSHMVFERNREFKDLQDQVGLADNNLQLKNKEINSH